MDPSAIKERTRVNTTTQHATPDLRPLRISNVLPRPQVLKPSVQKSSISESANNQKRSALKYVQYAKNAVREKQQEKRFRNELEEMQQTHDLREVDDDVEDVATMYEWRAPEHVHRPKSPAWFAVLAASITVISLGFLLFGNILAFMTIALAGGLVYHVAQYEPRIIRYRLLTEGVAFDNTLYHYKDVQKFNIIYDPSETKTVLIQSKRTFAHLLHMEIGNADPVAIRDILVEFIPEDIELEEPLVDILARRVGF